MELPTAISGEKPHITVYLSNKHESKLKYFRCVVCGHKVFGYYSDAKIILAGHGVVSSAPLEVQCNGAITVEENGRLKTTRCKAVYLIE